MSPLSSEPTPSRSLWRAALVYAAVVASVALILGPILYVRSTDAIHGAQRAVRYSDRATNHTRKLSCSITALLGKTPLKPLPGQTQADFLRRERGFAVFLAGLERSHSHCGPSVTRRLRHKLRQARRLEATRRRPGSAGGNSHPHAAATVPPAANPAVPGAGATTTSPPTTSPGSSAGSGGGGGSGNGGGTPPAPGPTPPPKPQPPPHNPPPAPPPKCVVNALGICVPNPL